MAAGPESESDAGELTGATSTGVEPRLAAVLSYTAWWLSGLVFLVIEERHRGVRFHAAQSIVLFGGLSVLIALLVALSVGMLVLYPAAFLAARIVVSGVWIATVAIWLVLMFRTFKGETWRVPFVGEVADRLVGKDAE